MDIKFPEPTRELSEVWRSRMTTRQKRYHDKSRHILETVQGMRKKLDEIQEECDHPERFRQNIPSERVRQCLCCGWTTHR